MTLERMIDYFLTVVLLVVTAVAVWKHQNTPGPGEKPDDPQT